MLRFAALLTCLLTPAAAVAQDTADPMVAQVAASLEPQVGRDISRTMHLTAVRAEGQSLILDIDLTPDSASLIGPPQVAAILAMGICADAQGAIYFEHGRGLRVAVTKAGRALGTAAIDHCPGPIGQGMTPTTFAGAMQSMVGLGDNGVRIAAVRAEGDTLIVTIDLPARTMSEEEIRETAARGICRRPQVQTSYFGHGFKVRVDTTVQGRALHTGPLITECPRP
jgi:hypothetical protein